MIDTSRYSRLIDSAKRLLSTRYDLLLLTLLEKLSRIIGLILLVLVAVLGVFAAFAFGTFALALVLSKWIPLWAACLIMGALFLMVLALVIAFRQPLIINPIVAALSGIIFSPDGLANPTALISKLNDKTTNDEEIERRNNNEQQY